MLIKAGTGNKEGLRTEEAIGESLDGPALAL